MIGIPFSEPQDGKDFFPILPNKSGHIVFHGTSAFFQKEIEQDGFIPGRKFYNDNERLILAKYYRNRGGLIPFTFSILEEKKGVSFTKTSTLALNYARGSAKGGNYRLLGDEIEKQIEQGLVEADGSLYIVCTEK